MLTTIIQNHEVLANPSDIGPMAKTYANRTQAEKAATKAGEGWEVIKWVNSRPWFVGREI